MVFLFHILNKFLYTLLFRFIFFFEFVFLSLLLFSLWFTHGHLFSSILQIESYGQLEIQLDCTALMFTLENVSQLNIYFGTIESSISFVYFVIYLKYIQSLSQLTLSLIPFLQPTQIFSRSRRQFQTILEAKQRIYIIKQIKYSQNLI